MKLRVTRKANRVKTEIAVLRKDGRNLGRGAGGGAREERSIP